jgi:hypothetical protein
MDAAARWLDQGLHVYTGTETASPPMTYNLHSRCDVIHLPSSLNPAKSAQSRRTSLRERFSSSFQGKQGRAHGLLANIKAASHNIFQGRQEPEARRNPESQPAGGIADSFKDFAKGAIAATHVSLLVQSAHSLTCLEYCVYRDLLPLPVHPMRALCVCMGPFALFAQMASVHQSYCAMNMYLSHFHDCICSAGVATFIVDCQPQPQPVIKRQ